MEAAWRKGIVVVVAAGNDGTTDTRGRTMPAREPVRHRGRRPRHHRHRSHATTTSSAAFSTRGNTDPRHADLVAPGRSIVSLRDPGSFIDANYPDAA